MSKLKEGAVRVNMVTLDFRGEVGNNISEWISYKVINSWFSSLSILSSMFQTTSQIKCKFNDLSVNTLRKS